MTNVLQVLSAARVWTLRDGTEHPTGFWAEEFVVPYTLFTEAGWDVTVATPGYVS
jgi:putative intracellular protease/amidase